MKTTIENGFTGYSHTINTKSLPAVSTIRKHLKASKASDCKSATAIRVNGIRHVLVNLGSGLELQAAE
jgi:hypothetical protein